MSESLEKSFLEVQKQQMKKARELTVDPERPRGSYTNLSSGLDKYESLLFDGRSLLEVIAEMRDLFPDETINILDFGCGHNSALRELKQKYLGETPIHATGVSAGDPRTQEEKMFDESHQIAFIDKDDDTPSLSLDTYHIIMSRLAVGHLVDPLGALIELYNSLRQNGIMYIDFSINDLAKKFVRGVEGFRKSIEEARKVIDDVKTEGIDIQSDGKKLVIRKNVVPLSFAHVKISPIVSTGITEMGVYIYE